MPNIKKKIFSISHKDETHRGAATARLFGWKSLDEIVKQKQWKVAKKEPKSRNGKETMKNNNR